MYPFHVFPPLGVPEAFVSRFVVVLKILTRTIPTRLRTVNLALSGPGLNQFGFFWRATPVGDLSGSIEVLNQEPNKTRTFIQLDLSGVGLGKVIQDQRFDGTSGYVIDTMQGNRDITGDQLEAMKNGSFPNPLLNYKQAGATVELSGKEKVGEREAYVLVLKPKSGPVVRQYIDAESYLPIKVMVKINFPQVGGEIEQTTETFDFRDVDGVKIPFRVKTSSAVQKLHSTHGQGIRQGPNGDGVQPKSGVARQVRYVVGQFRHARQQLQWR